MVASVWPGRCLKLQTADTATSLMTPPAAALCLMALMTDWAQMTDREQWPRPIIKHCHRYLLSSCVVQLVNGTFQLNFIDCDRKHNKKVNTAIFEAQEKNYFIFTCV